MHQHALHPWRWPAWAWLAGLATVVLVRFPIHFALSPPYLMDFEVYRAIALRIAEGGGAALYQSTTSESMLFKYAPCWALAWLPLAWIPQHAGAVVWEALTVLWLILSCWTAMRVCQRASLRVPPAASVIAVLLLIRPITAEFLNGQVDILWGLLVTGSLLTLQAGHRWRPAIWLALAIALKLPAIIFLAYFLIRRQWAFSARVVAVFLAVNMLAVLCLNAAHPLQLLLDWMRVLWTSGADRAFEIGNQSLTALTARFLSADVHQLNVASLSHAAIVLISGIVSALLFSMTCVGSRSQDTEPLRHIFDGALLMILMVLCSPTTWIATYSALVFPAIVAVACATASWRRPWPRMVTAVAGPALLMILSLMTHSKFWKALGIFALRGESYVFLVLMILPWFGLVLFAYLWRQRSLYIRGRGSSRAA